MPIPTKDEILRMRECLAPRLSEDAVLDLMALWGPNPRYTLIKTSAFEQNSLMDWVNSVKIDLIDTTNSFDKDWLLIHQRAFGEDAAHGTIASDTRNPEYYRRGSRILAPIAMMRLTGAQKT